jgi:hypothetical protein
MAAFFQFGGEFLRDHPIAIHILTDSGAVEWPIGDENGVVFNPGEPLARIIVFYPPQQAGENVTTGGKRLIRFVEMIPWERIKHIALIYPPITETDPDKFKIEQPANDGRLVQAMHTH